MILALLVVTFNGEKIYTLASVSYINGILKPRWTEQYISSLIGQMTEVLEEEQLYCSVFMVSVYPESTLLSRYSSVKSAVPWAFCILYSSSTPSATD